MKINVRYFAIIGILIFVYLLYRIGPGKIFGLFEDIKWSYVLLFVILTPLLIFLKSLKWQVIIKAYGMNYPILKCIKVWLITSFFGAITPSRAGELLRVYYLKREKFSVANSLSTVIVDKILELVTLLALSFVGILMLYIWFGKIYFAVFIIGAILVFMIYVSMKKNFVRRILRPIFKRIVPENKKELGRVFFEDFYKSLENLKQKKKEVAYASLISFISWFVSILGVYFLALALGLKVSYLFILAIYPIVIITEWFPFSFSGIGVRDVSLIFFFSLAAIGAEYAVAYALLTLLSAWFIVAPGGILWLFEKEKISF
ncbi:MAG: flippase-like domain-containing protein [bacterium]|nr:flippase-like domain-containing protein [bacterium]